jgi:hypothetical protein
MPAKKQVSKTTKKASTKRAAEPKKHLPGNTRLEEISRNVHFINHRFHSTSENFWVLLTSDRHHDNPHCNQDLEKKHLDEAKERNAVILDYGDLFCAMQGKFDRRASKDDIRPEHQHGNYLDRLVATATDFYAPYADNFAVMGPGNHETAMLKHHETNLTERLVERLNMATGSEIKTGGYSGWVKFKFWYGKESLAEHDVTAEGSGMQKSMASVNLWYHHGYGGDAPVTKGTIQTGRQSVYVPDAHIVCTGHTHNEWIFPITRIRIKDSGLIYHDEQLHLKTPGYKEEYEDGYGGWHIERGGPPKPNGAMWLRFFWLKSNDPKTRGIQYEVTRAK